MRKVTSLDTSPVRNEIAKSPKQLCCPGSKNDSRRPQSSLSDESANSEEKCYRTKLFIPMILSHRADKLHAVKYKYSQTKLRTRWGDRYLKCLPSNLTNSITFTFCYLPTFLKPYQCDFQCVKIRTYPMKTCCSKNISCHGNGPRDHPPPPPPP